jgi:hypothetical protein
MGPETKNNYAGEGQQQITAMLLSVVENGSNKKKLEVPVLQSELEYSALPINIGPLTCIFSEIAISGCS